MASCAAVLQSDDGDAVRACLISRANEDLARQSAAARGREMAIRSALGSDRLRTVGQVLIEAGLLALAGAALGVLFAVFAVRAFDIAMSSVEELPYWVRFEVNGRVLLFALATSALSALVAGLVPAVRASRPNLSERLRDGAPGATSYGLGHLSRSLAVFALARLSTCCSPNIHDRRRWSSPAPTPIPPRSR